MSCAHKSCEPLPIRRGDSLARILEFRSTETPDALAYRFLADGVEESGSLTYGGLDARARAIAAALVEAGATGAPVVVAHPCGLEFLEALFGCWYAGAIAVPCYPPQGRRHRERLSAVLGDSGAKLALAPASYNEAFDRWGVNRLEIGPETAAPDFQIPEIKAGPCLLQYTSGSTASPKGVQVTHANLVHQLEVCRDHVGQVRSLVGWLPPYHDMGLVLKIVHAVGAGAALTFFPPEAFARQPMCWLRAIHRYRADFSAAPNFAFEQCLRAVRPEDLEWLDLSCWKAAPCGAERVRADTLERFAKTFSRCGFRAEAILPGYGLAEATLTVSARKPGTPPRELRGLVSCGHAVSGMRLRIEDPASHQVLAEGCTGEIVVSGPSVAAGYWQRSDESAEAFQSNGWLRTGDLGFLDEGELFVEGRLKDLLIVDGANHAPEDLEMAASSADPELTASAGAAFALQDGGPEKIVLVQEIPRLTAERHAPLCHAIRRGVGEHAGIALDRVLLVRPGTLPRTTSGKIRRASARRLLQEGAMQVIHEDSPTVEELDFAGRSAFDQLAIAVTEATGRPTPRPEDDPVAYGLSSLDATRVVALLRAYGGADLPVGEMFAARSFAALANLLAVKPAAPVPKAIPTRDPLASVPSHSQERMWFLHQLEPQSAAYHVFGALDLEGPLDEAALSRAFQAILSRHEILRSRHSHHAGVPVISIVGMPEHPISTEDAGGLDDAAIEIRLTEFARQPFDLAADAPVRVLHLRRGGGAHVLALCAHHIVADGWSIRILLGELTARYREECLAAQPLPAPLSPSYLDYAAWHRGWVESGGADEAVAYWKGKLEGHDGALSLPLDFPRPARSSSEGAVVGCTLPAALLEKVKQLAVSRRTTPFCVLLAGFLATLRRHGGGEDPVVAVPVANRNHAASGPMIGTLVNTLPFRPGIAADDSFGALVECVHLAALEMHAAQEAPFERIIEAVQPERVLDRSPLAQVMFDHQEIPLAATWAGEVKCRPRLAHRGATQFDLSMLVFAFADHHEVYLEYRTDLFRRETIAALLERYGETLEQGVSSPGMKVSELHGLTRTDDDSLAHFSKGPERPEFLHRVPLEEIGKSLQASPERIALICGETSLTAGELWARVGRLAASFQARGIRSGQRVAVLLDRDEWLPVVLLAIWRAGAAYVPLDAANPPERLGWILEDQSPLSVLVSPALTGHLPLGARVILFDPVMAEENHPPVEAKIVPTDPAYILYTSGSTGRPKGVVIQHGALANFLLSMLEEPGLKAGDRLAALTTVSFDISALEIHLPLLAGAVIDLIPGHLARDGAALRSYLEAHPPTVLQATPATWRMLIAAGWQGSPGLKILCGGEALDAPLARQLTALGHEVWNLYGPTETTVWSTLWKVPSGADRILIGRPIANTSVHVVDEAGHPVPPGVSGMLFIGGAGLAEGYWNRPELTAKKFITRVNERLYDTGDLARWMPDGILECLGRSDGQVKVRGFRIELAEIESALLAHDAVAEVAAVVTGAAGESRLAAYYRVNAPVTAEELTRHLAARLPDYMIPAPLVEIATMPLTSSGKIDRRALASIQPASAPAENPGFQDSVEAEVAAVWAQLLGTGPLGRTDDFFALGGHSLLATRMTAELSERLGFPVALDALFRGSTVAGFASRLKASSGIDFSSPRAILLHQGNSASPPLFWIHTLVDGGMGLFPYRDAAGSIGDLTSYGIAEGARAFESLEDMARMYVEIIRSVQPCGPYRLAGFCFGGNVAAEVSAQLTALGETIETLVLLESRPTDACLPASHLLRPASWRHFTSQLWKHLPRIMAYDPERLAKRMLMKCRAAVTGLCGLFHPRGIPDIHAVLDLSQLDEEATQRARLHWQALHLHRPRLPKVERLVVVRAEDDGWFPTPPDLGWERHAKGSIESVSVSGRHEEFLRGGSAAEVAKVMRGLWKNDGA
ncbi:MAG: amino acid adenylation domain-containing protein [Luteolibacter sp.]